MLECDSDGSTSCGRYEEERGEEQDGSENGSEDAEECREVVDITRDKDITTETLQTNALGNELLMTKMTQTLWVEDSVKQFSRT